MERVEDANGFTFFFGHSNHQLTLTVDRLFLIIAVAFSGITAGPIICAAEQYSDIPLP